MDSVKFVPPGGHRACLSCSAAKAKCVFSDDAEVGDSLNLGPTSFIAENLDFSSSSAAASAASSPGAAHVEGTPAIPRCERCERLNRDCLLPTRPRKKRRVGVLKPGTSRPTSSAVAAGSKAASDTSGHADKIREADRAAASASFSSLSATKVLPLGSTAASRGSGSKISSSPLPANLANPSSTGSSHINPSASAGAHDQPLRRGSSTSPLPQIKRQSPSMVPLSTLPPSCAPGAASPYTQGRSPGRTGGFATSMPPGPAHPSTTRPPTSTGPSPHPFYPQSSVPSVDVGGTTSFASPISNASAPQPPQPAQPQQQQRITPHLSPASLPGPQNPHQIVLNSVFHMHEREAEEHLRFYRDAYSQFNAYMEPPSIHTKASELQTQRPFVWMAIVFVTSFHDFERQNRLARAMIFYLTDQVFQNNVKNLDLLQGTLIFLNWFITQNFVLPQFTNIIHVAMALVTELGLNKLEFSKTAMRSPLDRYVAKTIHGPGLRAPDEGQTLEERRAHCGGFCLSQAMSNGILLVTPLNYTLQLEETCRFFETAFLKKTIGPEPITTTTIADYHLAITVRIYHLISRAVQVQREADLCGGRFTIPVRTHIENFMIELDRLWESLPRETKADFKIQLLYYTAEIYIYELGLSTQTTPFKTHSTPSRESDDGSSSSDVEMPIKCYMAVKKFFDVFLTLPLNLYHQFSLTLFTQLVHADLTLAKLTAYFRGNTQPPGVPEGVTLPAFPDVIEAVASRFASVRTVPHPLGYTVANIMFDAFATRLRSFKLLDLAGRRRMLKAAKRASMQQQQQQRQQTPSSSHNAFLSSTATTTPAAAARQRGAAPPGGSGGMMSIDSLIGNVPQASEFQGAEPERPYKPYPSVEMDVETDSPRDEALGGDDVRWTPDDIEMADTSGSDFDEQAEWWAWFGDFQSSLFGQAGGSTTAGSVAGSVAGGSAMGGGNVNYETPARRPVPSSVGSIGSLLNNDQDPSLNRFMQRRN